MNAVTIDPVKLDAAVVELRQTIDEYSAKLAAFKPTDPPHWRPNTISARSWVLQGIGNRLVDAHFEGRRFRGASLERRKEDLRTAIKDSAAWRDMLAYLDRHSP